MEPLKHRKLTMAATWVANQPPAIAALREVSRSYQLNQLDMAAVHCAFRAIRPPIPTTSAHPYRGIRPPCDGLP